jgi:simple sugar transport system permease protein
MSQRTNTLVTKYRRFIPLSVTALLVFVAYGIGAILYPAMRNPQVFFNLFQNNSYLLISAIGMTFVILTGGIDLSVSGVVALTTVASAALLREGWNEWIVILLMLLMGMTLGATMGSFIAFMKVQPFIATLAGMWFARGMCFFISDDAIAIDDRFFHLIGKTKLLIPD